MGSGFRGCFHKLTHLDLRCPAVDQRSLISVMETPDLLQIHPLVQMHSTALWHTLTLGTHFAKSRAVCQLQIDIMWPANSELEHIISCAQANSAKMCLCLIQIESVLPQKTSEYSRCDINRCATTAWASPPPQTSAEKGEAVLGGGILQGQHFCSRFTVWTSQSLH